MLSRLPHLIAALIALTATASGSAALLEVKGLLVPVGSMSFAQTTDPKGNPVISIELTFRYGNGVALVKGMSERMTNNGRPLEPLPMKLYVGGTPGVPLEARTYAGVTVREIHMPTLDASGRDELDVAVRLSATGVTVQQLASDAKPVPTKSLKLIGSNFELVVTGQSLSTPVKIASHRLIPCASMLCDSISAFSVLVFGQAVPSWRAWHQMASQNPSYSTTAAYTVLDNQLARVYGVNLTGVRPISYSETIVDGIVRARIDLVAATATVK